MTQEITLDQFQRWLIVYADRIAEKEGYLTELDAAIGDADHGINMRRGTERLRQRLLDMANCTEVSTFLRTVAMTLIGSVGGAAGPLYGSFFLHAAKQAARIETEDASTASGAADRVTPTQLARIFQSGLQGVKQRGKAQVGEKTMIDTLQPAIEAMQRAAEAGEDTLNLLTAACDAAKAGMQHTIELQAKKGRASYLGPRSIGHQDPGATSAYYLFTTALETLAAPKP